MPKCRALLIEFSVGIDNTHTWYSLSWQGPAKPCLAAAGGLIIIILNVCERHIGWSIIRQIELSPRRVAESHVSIVKLALNASTAFVTLSLDSLTAPWAVCLTASYRQNRARRMLENAAEKTKSPKLTFPTYFRCPIKYLFVPLLGLGQSWSQ